MSKTLKVFCTVVVVLAITIIVVKVYSYSFELYMTMIVQKIKQAVQEIAW